MTAGDKGLQMDTRAWKVDFWKSVSVGVCMCVDVQLKMFVPAFKITQYKTKNKLSEMRT